MSDERIKILPQVKTPLVFFALSLLILEGIIGVVIAKSQMSGEQQLYAVYAMGVIFLVVILLVAAITAWRPSHLFGFDTSPIQNCKCPKCGNEFKPTDDLEREMSKTGARL